MKKPALIILLVLICLINAYSQFSPGYYALKDISVIDGISDHPFSHYTIIIRHNMIEAVGPAKEVVIPDSAQVFNYSGKFLIPGLIDSHVHLATDPSNDDKRVRAEKDLKDMLLSGITTVRDMAGDAQHWPGLSRDARLDEIVAPDIYYSALMAGPAFFKDPRTFQTTQGGLAGAMPYMLAVTDSTNLVIAVAEAKGTGATGIKLYAELGGALVKKITEEAHRQHLLVWSHANLQQATTIEVVNSGVNVISHAAMVSGWNSRNIAPQLLKPALAKSFWDSVFSTLPVADLINAMLKNHTILDATILTYKEAGSDTSIPEKSRLTWQALYEAGKRFTAVAEKNGIPVSAGTDLDERKICTTREMKQLVEDCAFTPMQSLKAATMNGAMTLGMEAQVGSIQKGKIANLVLLSADPSRDINNIDKVELVIKNGKLFNAGN